MLFFGKILDKKSRTKTREDKLPGAQKPNLEKGDIPAMVIAALLVITPFFLIIVLSMFFMGWVFGAF